MLRITEHIRDGAALDHSPATLPVDRDAVIVEVRTQVAKALAANALDEYSDLKTTWIKYG